MTTAEKLQLMDDLINHLIDSTGLYPTIRTLLDLGYSPDDLLDLGFVTDDIHATMLQDC